MNSDALISASDPADSLVAYLLSLKNPYTFPEAVPFTPAKAEGATGGAK